MFVVNLLVSVFKIHLLYLKYQAYVVWFHIYQKISLGLTN